MRRRFARNALLVGVAALVAASCGGDDDDTSDAESSDGESGSGEPVTIEWWHIQNNDPGLSLWEDVAGEFEAEHPNVTIDITVYENEAFKTGIDHAAPGRRPAGPLPVVGRRRAGEQLDAGLVKDVTDDVEPWIDDLNQGAVGLYQVDDAQYGVPFDLGMVGFWYNTDLFAQAGIDEPPATWDELLEDVQTLEDEGITPIAAQGDKWPGMFWWAYLGLRNGGARAMFRRRQEAEFDSDPFVGPASSSQELIEMEPFQEGSQAAVWDGAGGQAATMATGGAAFDAHGPVGARHQNANSPDGDGLGDSLGWFPFPEVDGGDGDPPTASAVATASRWAPTPRPRRSSSSNTSRPETSPTGGARRTAASCRWWSDPRARSPTRTSPASSTPGPRPTPCSSTSTRPTTRPSARASTTPSSSSSPGRPPRRM